MIARTARWTPAHVSSAAGPELAVRTYIEQCEVRELLAPLRGVPAACETGAGYGRMTRVLTEIAGQVTAFEAEPDLLELGARLSPAVRFAPLAEFAGGFPLAMTFTFLQHLDDEAAAVMCGLLASCRHVLIAEECNPGLRRVHDDGRFTQGRPLEQYRSWLAPLRLVRTRPRHYDRPSPHGHHPMYLLFTA